MNLNERLWPCRMNFHPEHGFVIFARKLDSRDSFELVHNLPFEESYRVLTSHELKELGPDILMNLDYVTLLNICVQNTETSRTLRAEFAVGYTRHLDETKVILPKVEIRRIQGFIMSCPARYFETGFNDFKSFEIFWKRYSYSKKLRNHLSKTLELSKEEVDVYYYTHEKGKKMSISEFIRTVNPSFFDRFMDPKHFFENWKSPYIHDNFVELSMMF